MPKFSFFKLAENTQVLLISFWSFTHSWPTWAAIKVWTGWTSPQQSNLFNMNLLLFSFSSLVMIPESETTSIHEIELRSVSFSEGISVRRSSETTNDSQKGISFTLLL